MKTRKLIKDIDNFFVDMKDNPMTEVNTDFSKAIELLARAVKVLKKNNEIDNEMKRHSKGLEKAIDTKD